MALELNEQQAQRLAAVRELEQQGIEAYPARSGRTHTAREAIALFEAEEASLEGQPRPDEITLAGRVIAIRDMGKAIFSHIRDGSGAIQLYARRNILGEEAFARFKHTVDLGDFIEASGRLFRTRTGEVTLEVNTFRMLAKAINPPPEKWHGLTDVETRYRQRYVDLMANEEVRQIFITRGKIIQAIRRFLDERGFLEVETPTLQPLYGGAAARPFTTHYHALDQTFYLRIADELYLKRLLVGGFERVYEICKDFRNEGIDARHSPEFTMLELYMAYADYRDIMELFEQMVSFVAREALGTEQITWGEHQINLTPPWPRLSLRQAILDETGIDFLKVTEQTELYERARAVGAKIEPGTVWPRIVDELLKTFVQPKLIQPTFLVDYPVQLSPLAKQSPENPAIVERFQAYIAGMEVGNAFSELNNPMEQLNRFLIQARDRAAGDEEAMVIDEDFIRALMYGMPPTGGLGVGIDRLTMLFTNQQNIREVILFPHLRSKFDAESRLLGAGQPGTVAGPDRV